MTFINEISKKSFTVYVAKPEFIDELCNELTHVSGIMGNLVFSEQEKLDVCFALDIWRNPKIISFESITEAAKILQNADKFWQLYPLENIRRSHLITEKLRRTPKISLNFPLPELPHISCFSLLDKNTLLYATDCWKKIPFGHYAFIEDKVNPPNRAYLKLWEALSILERLPQKNALVVDLGASPGGWSYVMQSLGARVIAVDKAELDPKIAKLPRIEFLKQSAFALDPNSFDEPVDWLLCDVACYPKRLYDLTLKWIAAKKAKQFIFTIKLQGKTDLEVIKQFQAIPGGQVLHLFQNKHEVTFFYPAVDSK
jgi:23S rRNA (cytidine2498-2'-O)-methyltransferase